MQPAHCTSPLAIKIHRPSRKRALAHRDNSIELPQPGASGGAHRRHLGGGEVLVAWTQAGFDQDNHNSDTLLTMPVSCCGTVPGLIVNSGMRGSHS